MKTYLLTRPEHDDTTYYLSQWSKITIQFAKNKGIRVIDLHRERAERGEVESILNKLSPKLVVFNGHGNEKAIGGHDNKPIIIAGKNENLLKSKIIYSISCKSAKILGLKSIEAGAINFTGYNDDFIFVFETNKVAKPLEDETAKLFLEPSNLFITSLIKGNSIKESYNKSKNLMKKTILQLLGDDTQDTNLVRFLWWNLKHFVSYGDLKATF